jgi:predicted flap endonuclease-1-like 5' DNA nuclease
MSEKHSKTHYVFKAARGHVVLLPGLQASGRVIELGSNPLDLALYCDPDVLEASLKDGTLRNYIRDGAVFRCSAEELSVETPSAPAVIPEEDVPVQIPESAVELEEATRIRDVLFEHFADGVTPEVISETLHIPLARVQVAKREYDLKPDDLTVIPGIHNAREQQLNRVGVRTYKQLASLKATELVLLLGDVLPVSTCADWIEGARRAMKGQDLLKEREA